MHLYTHKSKKQPCSSLPKFLFSYSVRNDIEPSTFSAYFAVCINTAGCYENAKQFIKLYCCDIKHVQ